MPKSENHPTISSSGGAPNRWRAARLLNGRARTALFTLAAFAGGAVSAEVARAKTERQSPYAMMDQLARVLVWIENEYVDPVDRARLIEGGIKGMVAELDPHSSYMPPEDYGVFQGDTEGHFGGIGVEVDFSTDSVVVIAPIEGSPAELAGIRSGDRIIAIDGQPVRDRSPADLVRTMRGDPGSKVLITIRREGADHLLFFTLVRRVVVVTSISSKLLDGKVAYLRVKTFQSGTHAELIDHIGRLRKAAGGAFAGVVLDLRNNPGGLVNEASAVADELLDGGVIYTTRRRGQVVDEVRADAAGALRSGPAAVLVNEFSASASELVAGALRDQHRATLVGATTFGKGSVQTIIDLPGGAGLRLTTLRYYTPSGQAIQARGVTPEVLVGGQPGDYGIVREQNLEGHLPAVEGALTKTPSPSLSPPAEPKPGAGPLTTDDVDHGVVRDVPADPRGGPDAALATAYEIVRRAAQPKR
jgi:carboxyl-terminal processing protease